MSFCNIGTEAFSSMSTMHDPCLQTETRENDSIEFIYAFNPPVSCLTPNRSKTIPFQQSPADAIIDYLDAFLGVLARRKGARIAKQLIGFFHHKDFDIVVFHDQLIHCKDTRKVVSKHCEIMFLNSCFQETGFESTWSGGCRRRTTIYFTVDSIYEAVYRFFESIFCL